MKKLNVKKGCVLVLRTNDKDNKSNNGRFQYPKKGYIEAPDWNKEKQYQAIQRFVIYLLIFAIIIVGTYIFIKYIKNKDKQEEPQTYIDIADNYIIELDVWSYILKSRVQHPEIVFAQAKLESANFTSPLFVKSNNIFGMQYPLFRPTTAKGRSGMYANYECWKHSIHDYIIWQSIYGRNLTENQYFELLDNIYVADTLYVQKLKYIINE